MYANNIIKIIDNKIDDYLKKNYFFSIIIIAINIIKN